MKHLKSLGAYLEATGSERGFQDIRYWELGQSRDRLQIRKISLNLHLELLHALRELLLPSKGRKDTVSMRVETDVRKATRSAYQLSYDPGTDKERSMKSYTEWLNGFESDRGALEEAFREGVANGDDFMLEVLSKAYQELANSTDPAVQYFAETLTVLPVQPRDVVPCVEWLGPETYQIGKVSTPGGYDLGFISLRADRLWSIEPIPDGTVPAFAIAETETDARCFLASILTRLARVIVNGEERNLRIVGEEYDLFGRNYDQVAEWHEKPEDAQQATYQVEFWDDQHGIADNDSVKLEVQDKDLHNSVDVLEGTVTDVADHKVYVSGIEHFYTDDKYSKPDRG